MNLWDAAQGVSVLYAVFLAVAQNFGTFGQEQHIFRNLHLAFLTTNSVYAWVEGIFQTGEAFHGQRCDNVSHFSAADGVIESKSTNGSHSAGTVGETQTFFANQSFQSFDACFSHCFCTRHFHAFVNCAAFTQQRQTHMCQRSQVTGGTQRTFLRNNRNHIFVQHIDEHFYDNWTNTGYTAAESVCTEQQHAANYFFAVWVAVCGAVAEDQIGGQLVGHFFRNSNVLEVTETGGNAVSNAFFSSDFFCQCAGFLHCFQSFRSKRNFCAVACNSNEAFDGQRMTVDDDFFDCGWFHKHRIDTHFL